jgi:hypothetical protein
MSIGQAKDRGFARVMVALATAVSLLCLTAEVRAAPKSAACNPVESAVFENRIHVRCEHPVDGRFPYFAVPTSDPKFANRVLSVILLAQESGKVVTIDFDPLVDPLDAAGSGFGCNRDNCRKILGIVLDNNTLPPPPPPPPPPRPPQPPSAARTRCMTLCADRFDACEGAASTQPALARCRAARTGCEAQCPP